VGGKAAAAAAAGNGTQAATGPHLEPSERVLKLWRESNAVCFDVDVSGRLAVAWLRAAGGRAAYVDAHTRQLCHPRHPTASLAQTYITNARAPPPKNNQCTITVNDSLDLLAEFMGVGESVAAVTNKVTMIHVRGTNWAPGVGLCRSSVTSSRRATQQQHH
jgi:hypothetical protein